MIDFTRAFNSAWERTQIILFRPFDFGKWCVIGFSAFLAGLLSGGNGVNFQYNQNTNFNSGDMEKSYDSSLQQIHSSVMNLFTGMQIGLIIGIVAVVMVVIFVLVLVMYWLGSRGQFLFLDNIVRNRGAIVWPWQYYARQANSLFWFQMLIMAISFAVILPLVIVAIAMGIPLYTQHRWPHAGEIAGFVGLGLIYMVLTIVFSIVLFIFREFGVPIMFRNGLLARAAFWESMRLLRLHPGSVILFVLLRMAIFIGVAILSVIACCFTCCLAMIPYLGTLVLLPVLIYVRCFSLDCLAQFGPEFDIWTVDVPPNVVPSPQPPPG